MGEIVNRVDQSKIITLDLGQYYPDAAIEEIDLKDWLYQGLILKEKEFREAVRTFDWSNFDNKHVAVHCSTDAIIPVWAWMLIQTALKGHANQVISGRSSDMLYHLYSQRLQKELNPGDFEDKPVVIKGCGDKEVPQGVFMLAVSMLLPHVKSIMYGEPCSTVPVYKKKQSK